VTHNECIMDRPGFQLRLSTMLGLVACAALNIWLFRLSVLAGIIGLNVTKHVVIAALCQMVGVDRRTVSFPPAPDPTSPGDASTP
jgi:hypothetical protein